MLRTFAFTTLTLGLSVASQAASSVKIYGTVDSGLYYQSTSAASFNPSAADKGIVYGLKDGGVNSSIWGVS